MLSDDMFLSSLIGFTYGFGSVPVSLLEGITQGRQSLGKDGLLRAMIYAAQTTKSGFGATWEFMSYMADRMRKNEPALVPWLKAGYFAGVGMNFVGAGLGAYGLYSLYNRRWGRGLFALGASGALGALNLFVGIPAAVAMNEQALVER